jgi:branched-chain amino acid transport system ATP-binding protein
MLQLHEVVAAYGPVVALHGVSLEVKEGSIVTVLGANGAGKSTTLRAISGLLRPRSGSIQFDGQRIDHLSAEQIVSLGMSHIPEGRQLFSELTVLENLRLGAYSRFTGLPFSIGEYRRRRENFQGAIKQVYEYFPILAERRNQIAGTLSGGEQQMLAIARGLMGNPRLLLLDEPSMGLAPMVTREIFQIIHAINQTQGVTILVVEQNANLALEIAHYGYVLETGRIALGDTSDNLRANEAVRRSYLGY